MSNVSEELLSEKVQKYYGKYLTLAAEGDLSFIKNVDKPIFSKLEQKAFHDFADASMQLSYFRKASELLYNATHIKRKDGTTEFAIIKSGMRKFNTHLNPPKDLFSKDENDFFDRTGRSFSKMIAENPKRWIGRTYFKLSQNALKTINDIDSNHIESLNTKNVSLSPKSFGATITGARGNISSKNIEFTSHKQKFENEFEKSYTTKEKEQYSSPITKSEEITNKIYSTTYKAKEKVKSTYKAKKGTLKNAASKAVKIGAALGAVVIIGLTVKNGVEAYKFNKTSAHANPSLGYQTIVTQDTLDKLDDISKLIDSVRNSTTIPEQQELYEIRDSLDETLDLVINDLVRTSFEKQYPNLIIPEDGIETLYDKTEENLSDGSSGNYITINCHDQYGKEYKYVISEFTSEGENRTEDYFNNEFNLDYSIKDDIADSATGPHKQRTMAVEKVLNQFKQILEDTYDLAGSGAKLDIPKAKYDNAKVVDKETIFQLIEANFSLFEPEFKLVIPEKAQMQNSKKTKNETIISEKTVINNDLHDDR